MSDRIKYLKVVDYVENMIHCKHLKPGDRIPSVRTLMETLDTTRATVCKGMQLLADQKLIVCNVGSGSFVAEPNSTKSSVKTPLMIGLLLHTKADSYALTVLTWINEAAQKYGVKLKTACANGYGEAALKAARELRADGCQSLLIPWVRYSELSEIATFMRQMPLPTCLPVPIPGFESYGMEVPEVAGLGHANMIEGFCEYYSALGEKRIVLIGPDTRGDMAMQIALHGYVNYTSRNKQENLVSLVGSSTQNMDEVAAELAQYRGKLAVIAYDDIHAQRFMTAMHKLGLAAPQDFRIIGNNDTQEALFCDPPLSSGRPDYAKLGERILKSAIAQAQGHSCLASTPPPNMLIVRESCGGAGHIDEKLKNKLQSLHITIIENTHHK